MKCSECGSEMEAEAPLSAMGVRMYGRGVDDYVCQNPRCSRFGRKQ
jgi:transcription elongation factor Elf1